MNKLKRYLLFLVGLFINALGVSLITKASLGTSPISSIPYVLSLNFKFTLGNFTIFFSIFLILLQILILRKNFKLENILQIPVSIAFGYFIDLTMYLFFWVDPKNYLVKVIALLVGCAILGFRGTCRCCHAAGRILCPCDRADLENKFRNDENYFRYIDGSDRGCVVIFVFRSVKRSA